MHEVEVKIVLLLMSFALSLFIMHEYLYHVITTAISQKQRGDDLSKYYLHEIKMSVCNNKSSQQH